MDIFQLIIELFDFKIVLKKLKKCICYFLL